jgi:biotin operon repressor
MTSPITPTEQRTTPTASATEVSTGAHAQIWQALNDQPGATAAVLAQATRISRSTAAKALAAMEKDGLARREPGTPDGNRRVASHWYPNQPTPPHTNSPTDTKETATSEPHTAEEDEATGHEPPTPSGHNSPHEDHTEPTTPLTDDTETPEADEADSGEGPQAEASDTGDSPSHETEATPHQPLPPTLTIITGGDKQRLAPGALRQQVLNHLQAHPDTQFTATALSRAIGKSSGAIANALVTLEKHGQAQQVNDHPRRYQLRTETTE